MKIIENLLQIFFYKLTPSKFLTKAQQIQKGQLNKFCESCTNAFKKCSKFDFMLVLISRYYEPKS